MPRKNEIIELAGNQYTLIENIGNGGSGTVWSVQCNGEKYAVKFITSDSQSKILRFESEIAFCRNTPHRNIIKVIADGLYEKKPCYIMPYYSETFREVITREKDTTRLIKYILEICRGIKYIHAKGIIHRDIKPENILVKDKIAVLADFGIAHFKGIGLTNHHDLLANRNYMAPEQKIKNNAKKIDKSVDVYALGIIINECFTKQNIGGSWHQLIANNYPMLTDLDTLVTNMIRQTPQDRPDIDTIETELKFIYGKFKRSFQEVNANIRDDGYPKSTNQSLLKTIFNRATEDVLIGKHLFFTSTYQEFRQYNENWHMKIGYSVDDFLLNLYIQEQILYRCKAKFEYESAVYRQNNWYNTLNLESDTEHIALYQQMASILDKYKLRNLGELLLDLTGKILKYFAACADYHCKEILRTIPDLEESARNNLKDAPILWIVGTLKRGITENVDHLLNGIDGLGGKYDFKFEEHISINWSRTENFKQNFDDGDFFDKVHLEKERGEQKVLMEFQKKWKVKYSILDQEWCSIKFSTYSQYQKFKKYALELSKPHYIFEGDVLDIFANPNFIGGIVEIQLSRVFAIPHTLAKLMGLRKLNE